MLWRVWRLSAVKNYSNLLCVLTILQTNNAISLKPVTLDYVAIWDKRKKDTCEWIFHRLAMKLNILQRQNVRGQWDGKTGSERLLTAITTFANWRNSDIREWIILEWKRICNGLKWFCASVFVHLHITRKNKTSCNRHLCNQSTNLWKQDRGYRSVRGLTKIFSKCVYLTKISVATFQQ